MEELDLKKIWRTASRRQTKRYSMEEILTYRKKKSKQITRSGKLSILFDIGYKGFIALELIYLLFIIKDQIPFQITAACLLFITCVLIYIDTIFIKDILSIKETDSVVTTLLNKLIYLKTTHRKFIFISALSNPLFVFSSFLLYYMLKYGEIKIGTTLDYLIMFLFVFISFIIAYVSQLPVLRSHLKEIEESMEAFDDSQLATIKINQIKKRRQKQLIVFSILILAGILIFLILMISM